MDDAVKGTKDLLSETARAFKTGLHGKEYVPGSGGSSDVKRDEDLTKLDELRQSGTLTEEEYATARERLLQR
jgi:hypothetical protein